MKTAFKFRAMFHRNGASQSFPADAAPLRSELFSSDQMELHGKALARSHELSREPVTDQLLARRPRS